MTPNELVDKFIIDRFSLSEIELDELLALITKDHELVRNIKDSWLMDEYISRVLASDRLIFPAQVLKRISEINSNQKQELTMDQIIRASKSTLLSSSGRYRHKVLERKPSAISDKRPSSTSSKRSSTISNRRKFSKKSRSSPFVLLIAAVLILSIGVFLFIKMNSPTKNLSADAPITFAKNLESDLPTIVSGEKASVFNGASSKSLNYLGLSLKEGAELKVEKGGSLVLEYTDRTRVVLHEDSVLKVSNAKNKELYLDSGRISCEVSKQIVPFKITSYNSKIEVIGTVFEIGIQKDISNPNV